MVESVGVTPARDDPPLLLELCEVLALATSWEERGELSFDDNLLRHRDGTVLGTTEELRE